MIDPQASKQFGLVAEEVEKVNSDLIVRDKDGKPYSVRYDQVNAMLLNEFLKEHQKVEKQEATISQLKSVVAQQQKEFKAAMLQERKGMEAVTARLEEQASQIQKVSGFWVAHAYADRTYEQVQDGRGQNCHPSFPVR